MPFADGIIEPDYAEPFKAWKSDPTPENNSKFLTSIKPLVDDAVRIHVGQSHPLINTQAKIMALKAMQTYDPNKSKIRTHLYNQLQGLKRVNRKQTNIIRVPERISLERSNLENISKELEAELGREPTDHELANRSGLSFKRMARVRSFNPAVAEGTMEAAGEGQVFGGVKELQGKQDMWTQIVYDDLSPFDQKIMEMTLGLNGRKPMPNQDIARKLGRSPGLISQRKAAIQKLLDNNTVL